MNNDLLIVTYQYPYGNGEEFIDSELNKIASLFDHVWIIPSRSYICSKWWNSVDKSIYKDMPYNATVLTPPKNIIINRFRYVSYFVRIFSCAQYKVSKGSNYRRLLIEILKNSVQSYYLLCGVYELIGNISSIRTVYTYWKGFSTVSFLILRKNNLKKIKVLSRAHGGDLYYDLPHLPSRPFDQYIGNNIDVIASISMIGAMHMIENGFNLSKIVVSRLGVNIPSNISKSSIDGVIRIVSCSGMVPNKRVELLAEVMLLFDRKIIWSHFGDGPCMENVKNIIKKRSDNLVVNLYGMVSNEFIIKYYQSNPVDVFVNVSLSEGVPVSVMESLASGIPCIVTDVGGTSEIINNKVGCLLPPKSTPYEIMLCIDRELSDINNWYEKRKNARKKAEEMCDANKNYAEFGDLLIGL